MNKRDMDYLNKIIETGDKLSFTKTAAEVNIHYRESIGRLIMKSDLEIGELD